MIFNATIAILTLIIPVIWSTKGKGFGVFTAFLAAVCAVAAGGIAFALWEPTANVLLTLVSDSSSMVGNLLQSSAWGMGLILPYIVALGVLRLAVDSLVKANLDFSDNVNTFGGIAFGAVVSIITMGILAISVGHLRLGPSLMGYNPIEERNGSPVYTGGLWVPVDELTISFYEHLSRSAFKTGSPLAAYRPAAHQEAAMQRLTFKGSTRNTILPDQFELLGRYTVAGSLSDLVSDTFLVDSAGNKTGQDVFYPDGSTPSEGATLQGFVIRFNSGAKEKGGGVVMGPGQARLILELADGSAQAIHPIACVAPPDAGALGLYRFRYDAPEVFISSKGGASEAYFGFEFVVPKDAIPVGLLVRNTRVSLDGDAQLKEVAYVNAAARDAAIKNRQIFSSLGANIGGGGGTLETAGAVAVKKQNNRFEGIENGAELPDQLAFNKSNRGALDVSADNRIVEGEHTFAKAIVSERNIDRNLRVNGFQITPDTGMVKVELSNKGARSLYGRSVETAQSLLQPLLIDEQGSRYEPVGYVYIEGEEVKIRFTPGRPLRALSEAPTLSRTKTDQSLWLLFMPTKGVKLTSFALGSKVMQTFDGGVEVR